MYLTNKPGSSGFSSLIGILLVIGIVLGLVFLGVYCMDQIVDTSYDNVDVTVQVSGNDVVVTVLGGSEVSHLTAVHAHIDGAKSFTPNDNFQKYSPGQPIVFSGLASDVTGSAFVVVKGKFGDGRVGVITYSRLQFT